jgi:zinc finger protein GLIS2
MEYSGYSDMHAKVKKEDITAEHHRNDAITVDSENKTRQKGDKVTEHEAVAHQEDTKHCRTQACGEVIGTSKHCATQTSHTTQESDEMTEDETIQESDDELIIDQTTEQYEDTSDLAIHRTTEHRSQGSDELTVHGTTEDHTLPQCTSESPQLTVHRIVETGGHIMHPEDLVHCSTAVIFNDPTVIHSSSSSQSNTLVLTSVFNNTPILAVGEPAKSDMSIIAKVNPSDLLLPKSEHDSLTNNGSLLLGSPTQTTLLIPSYYHENDHLMQVTPRSVPLYQSTSASPLYGHLSQVHPCEWQDCEETFLTLEELVNHINNCHVLASKEACEYSCHWKNCVRQGKGFNARYKLLIHLRTHTGERPHACHFERCDKRFSRLENLKIHCRTHTGEKPYVCPFEGCEKRYSNSSDRFKHTRTHIESKPYRCKVDGCYKQYTDPSSLRKHLKAHKL